jgi:hypothetical protein
LEREAIQGWLAVDLTTMRREVRSMKLFEHTILASGVFGVLMDRERVIEMTSVVSMM